MAFRDRAGRDQVMPRRNFSTLFTALGGNRFVTGHFETSLDEFKNVWLLVNNKNLLGHEY
ncbi:MAG: hypothetical protein CL726_00740 [Chloroflexi bacterium]|nr:hypothetical protein [Chloroflexota bacterium]